MIDQTLQLVQCLVTHPIIIIIIIIESVFSLTTSRIAKFVK